MKINHITANSSQTFGKFGIFKKSQKTQTPVLEISDNDRSNYSKAISSLRNALIYTTILTQTAGAGMAPVKAIAEVGQQPARIVEPGSLPDYDVNLVHDNIQNRDIRKNGNKSIIINITSNKNGSTLREIINKRYSNALSTIKSKEQKTKVFHKLINKIINDNPELSKYVNEHFDDIEENYDDIADLNLHKVLNSKTLSIPTTILNKTQSKIQKIDSPTYSSKALTQTPTVTVQIEKAPTQTPKSTPTPIACSWEDITGHPYQPTESPTSTPSSTPTSTPTPKLTPIPTPQMPTPQMPTPTPVPTPIFCSWEDITGHPYQPTDETDSKPETTEVDN